MATSHLSTRSLVVAMLISVWMLAMEVPHCLAQTPATVGNAKIVGYVDDTAEGKRSLGASGHCEEFSRPPDARFIEAISIFASRYGEEQPPAENFHIYILNEKQQTLADIPVPYGSVERTEELRWYTFPTPAVEVPDKFYIALNFNPHQAKGIYLGTDNDVKESHSLMGLPDSGFKPVGGKYDWMVRLSMVAEPSAGKQVMRLADWKAPVKAEPFAELTELKYDNGIADNVQSYGGRGPAITFNLSDFVKPELLQKPLKIKGIKIYGSRYGSGYDTEQTKIKVYLIDSTGKSYAAVEVPYALFSYDAKWVDVPFPQPLLIQTAPQGYVTIAVDPEAHATKGIYFSYNKNPKVSHSSVSKVGAALQSIPEREWMIRAFIISE